MSGRRFEICAECVYRGEPKRVCSFCDEGDQFEEDTAVTQQNDSDPDPDAHDDGDEEGFGL